MPTDPPPRELSTDDITRFLARDAALDLLHAVASLRGKPGRWSEKDPQGYAAYLREVMRDPGAPRRQMETIPADHPDFNLRLDRCHAKVVTLRCAHCRASAVYAVADLRKFYGPSQNIAALPDILLPRPSQKNRREGACRVIAEPGGDAAAVITVISRYGVPSV
jgi:hypothetical protein